MGHALEPYLPDALVPHLSATLTMNWHQPPARIAAKLGRLHPQNSFPKHNGQVDQVLKKCGHQAFLAVSQAAQTDQHLTFSSMCWVQGLILDRASVSFRKSVAFTSNRKERYAYFSELEKMFRIKVEQDDLDACHPLIKAVRLYLDLIFFHPFPDGNSRAGLIWFAFHCMRAKYRIPDFRDFFGFGFRPGNKTCYWEFCAMAIKDVFHE